MALVKTLEHRQLERDTRHSDTTCSYCVIVTDTGEKQLQLDTYGSANRQIPGKKSQSIRLTSRAITQLRTILNKQFD